MSRVTPSRRALIVLAPMLVAALLAGWLSYLAACALSPALHIDPALPLNGQAGGLLLVVALLSAFALLLVVGWLVGALVAVRVMSPPSWRSWRQAYMAVKLGRYPTCFSER